MAHLQLRLVRRLWQVQRDGASSLRKPVVGPPRRSDRARGLDHNQGGGDVTDVLEAARVPGT